MRSEDFISVNEDKRRKVFQVDESSYKNPNERDNTFRKQSGTMQLSHGV
jgi:hypothetical protein